MTEQTNTIEQNLLKSIVNACKTNCDSLECLLDLATSEILNSFYEGKTPLMHACIWEPHSLVVKRLLNCDKCTVENVNRTTLKHKNALMIACEFQPKAVKYLIESDKCTNGNVEYFDYCGYTALLYACIWEPQPEAVKYLIESDKCTISNIEETCDDGYDALMIACIWEPQPKP